MMIEMLGLVHYNNSPWWVEKRMQVFCLSFPLPCQFFRCKSVCLIEWVVCFLFLVSEAIADMSAISLLLAEDSWVLRLLANQIGYVSFAIPVTILFLISKKSTYHRCKLSRDRPFDATVPSDILELFMSMSFSSFVTFVWTKAERSSSLVTEVLTAWCLIEVIHPFILVKKYSCYLPEWIYLFWLMDVLGRIVSNHDDVNDWQPSITSFSILGPKSVRFFLNPLIGLFIGDHSNGELLPRDANDAAASAHPPGAPAAAAAFTQRRIFRLVFSFFGLQISYLLWGLLQERIMTQTYDDEKFNNSQFLVFVNRFLATLIAYISVRIWSATRKSSNARAPLFCYGIISYANCMSTWFQYESLLYISFPVQVIAKSIKTIPVMLVGRFVSGKTYPVRQYVLMLIMASGSALFLTGYEEGGSKGGLLKKAARQLSPITTFNGFILLTCYLVSSKRTKIESMASFLFRRVSMLSLRIIKRMFSIGIRFHFWTWCSTWISSPPFSPLPRWSSTAPCGIVWLLCKIITISLCTSLPLRFAHRWDNCSSFPPSKNLVQWFLPLSWLFDRHSASFSPVSSTVIIWRCLPSSAFRSPSVLYFSTPGINSNAANQKVRVLFNCPGETYSSEAVQIFRRLERKTNYVFFSHSDEQLIWFFSFFSCQQ